MKTAMMDDDDNNEDVDNNNDNLTTDGRGSRHRRGSKVWTRSANKQFEGDCKETAYNTNNHKTLRVYPI